MNLLGYSFSHPGFFFLALIIPILALLHFLYLRKRNSTIHFPGFEILAAQKANLRERLINLPFVLRMLALLLLIIALARPQSFLSSRQIYSEGIDIALVLDISTSMLAEDFSPNRIEAAKKITDEFISGRISDRIGLVIFSRVAFTQCPVTIDYSVLKSQLKAVKSGMLEDGTAIGNAIANGVNRLKDSKSRSKVMLLLTDGMNNAGEVDPMTAADIARGYGIRIYTIGVGTMGDAPYPIQTPFGIQYQRIPVEIDEALLKKISDMTGGKYFRARNNKKLEEIYQEIDKMERSKIEMTSYRAKNELFYPFALGAFLILILEIALSRTLLRKLP